MQALGSLEWLPVSGRFSDLLDEATLSTLEKEVSRGFPDTEKRQYSVQAVDVEDVEYVPYVGVRTLLVKGSVLGEENRRGRKLYNPMILFTDVKYVDEDDPSGVVIPYGDDEYYILPVSMSENDIRCRCQCPDFLYRFSYWNHKNKALYGSPFKYNRKTQDRPPANPLGVVGACKHIFKLAVVLYNSGILVA